MNDQDLEQRLQELGANAPRLTPDRIMSKIQKEQFIHLPGSTLTICVLTLVNGYELVGHSACASPENYNKEIGEKLAKERAVRQIWELEGYVLKNQLMAIEVMKNDYLQAKE